MEGAKTQPLPGHALLGPGDIELGDPVVSRFGFSQVRHQRPSYLLEEEGSEDHVFGQRWGINTKIS